MAAMEHSLPNRILWPDGPIRVLFSVFAVLSAVGLYPASPRFAESPWLFATAAFALFTIEVLVFEFVIRSQRASETSRPEEISRLNGQLSTQTALIAELNSSINALQEVIRVSQHSAETHTESQVATIISELQGHLGELRWGFGNVRPEISIVRDLSTEQARQLRVLTGEVSALRSQLSFDFRFSTDAQKTALNVLDSLSIFEKQIVTLLAEGLSVGEVAKLLGLSPQAARDVLSKVVVKVRASQRKMESPPEPSSKNTSSVAGNTALEEKIRELFLQGITSPREIGSRLQLPVKEVELYFLSLMNRQQ